MQIKCNFFALFETECLELPLVSDIQPQRTLSTFYPLVKSCKIRAILSRLLLCNSSKIGVHRQLPVRICTANNNTNNKTNNTATNNAVPTCSDGTLNQDETAIDCGGATCDTCSDGMGCSNGDDCTSRVCLTNREF